MNTKPASSERWYNIVNGPSKDSLFDACKYAYNETAKVAVNFAVAFGYTMPQGHPNCAYIQMKLDGVQICGIEHEDGSGESFNLHGYCRADLNSCGGPANYTDYHFLATYNTKSRKGCISFK